MNIFNILFSIFFVNLSETYKYPQQYPDICGTEGLIKA